MKIISFVLFATFAFPTWADTNLYCKAKNETSPGSYIRVLDEKTMAIKDPSLTKSFKSLWTLKKRGAESILEASIPYSKCSHNVCLLVELNDEHELLISLYDGDGDVSEPYFEKTYVCEDPQESL